MEVVDREDARIDERNDVVVVLAIKVLVVNQDVLELDLVVVLLVIVTPSARYVVVVIDVLEPVVPEPAFALVVCEFSSFLDVVVV